MTTLCYIEKGALLHDRIRAAGHWLRCTNGVWQCSDAAAVQAIIDSYSLADSQAEICGRINGRAKLLRDAVVAGISPAEMASWAIKRSEAAAFIAGGNAADAPLLGTEALARGVALADIVARVAANALALAQMEAVIAGVAGKHRDAVNALDSFNAVLGYDYSAGWPVLP